MKTGLRRLWGPRVLISFAALLWAGPVQAGMTVYDLTDIPRLRLEDISFFALLLVVATVAIRFLWNYLAKGTSWLPRLTFPKALTLTALLSLLMLLILVMIAGARELLTPGAWYRQGSHYRPSDVGSRELRQQSLESLRMALMQYARAHGGQLPPHDYVSEIPPKLWQAPDSGGTRYVYLAGLTLDQTNAVVVCEPQNFGEERLVLFADGTIGALKTEEIHRRLGAKDSR